MSSRPTLTQLGDGWYESEQPTGSLLVFELKRIRRRIAAHLEGLEAEVTQTATLAEAREALRNVGFDFALLDVNLPDGRSLTLLTDQSIPSSMVTVP